MTVTESSWTRKKLLVWGKTYPEFSKTYYETVCTGAVNGDTGKLIRIYPITLRYKKEPFRLFDWIESEVQRNTSDFRPESFRIRQDAIRILENLDTTKSGWMERKKWVLSSGNVFQSVEELQAAEARDHTSLGLVRPREVTKIYVKRRQESDRQEWEEHRKAALQQKELFVDVDSASLTKDLAYMPVQYRACFRCDDPACKTEHDLAILDWGLYVLSRREYARGGPTLAENHVIDKVREYMDPTKRDPYFFLGNTKAHCVNFSIVGLFCPGKAEDGAKKGPDSQTRLPGF